MDTKLEKARIEFEKSRAVFSALGGNPELSARVTDFPTNWESEWQPPFPETSLREDLISAAKNKPIRKFKQIDVFQNFGGDDDFMMPDKDGDCIFSGQTYELNISHCLRVLIPSGATKEDAIRGLKKAIETVKKNPDVCSWNWGYIENDGEVIEPVIGVKYADNTKVNPIMETMKGLSQSELDTLIKAAQNIAQEKEHTEPF